MSIRTIATLVIAVVLGLIAVLIVRGMLTVSPGAQSFRQPINAGTVPVVVAAEPIARGQALELTNLKITLFPQTAVPAGSYSNVEQLVGPGGARLALSTIVTNEPVLSAKVSTPGGKVNMSAEIAPGKRAVSLRANDVSGVGGFVLPGDRVDVLVTRTIGNVGDAANMITQVLAEDVRVLGVDQSDNSESDKPVVAKAVTVEVTPEQAQEISLAQSVGTVSLMLRHVADDEQLARVATSVADLGFEPPKLAVRPTGHVRVIRGGDATTFSFNAMGGGPEQATPTTPPPTLQGSGHSP